MIHPDGFLRRQKVAWKIGTGFRTPRLGQGRDLLERIPNIFRRYYCRCQLGNGSPLSRSAGRMPGGQLSTVRPQTGPPGILRLGPKLTFDAQELVVLGRAVRTGQGSRLDLSTVCSNREIGYR